MRSLLIVANVFVASAVLAGNYCQAQMFGARTFGQSLQPQTNPGGGSLGGPVPAPGIAPGQPGAGQPGGTAPPSVNSSSRFLRQNRTTNDFVGKDANNPTRQVGTTQIIDNLGTQPAAMEVFERRVPETVLNPPRTATTRSRMYEPKLVVGFRPVPRPTDAVSASLNVQKTRLTQLDPNLQLTMTVEGSTVRLEGQVSSEEARALIEQVMLFEPGISAVQNDLKVLSVSP